LAQKMNPAAINKVFNESDESEKDKHKIKSRNTHIFSHLPPSILKNLTFSLQCPCSFIKFLTSYKARIGVLSNLLSNSLPNYHL